MYMFVALSVFVVSYVLLYMYIMYIIYTSMLLYCGLFRLQEELCMVMTLHWTNQLSAMASMTDKRTKRIGWKARKEKEGLIVGDGVEWKGKA